MKRLLILSFIMLILLVLAIGPGTGIALAWSGYGGGTLTTEQCLDCHGDPSFPSGALFEAAHAGQVGECNACHLEENTSIHGTWNDTTSACARCHRTHTAAADGLLITDANDLCMLCHGTTPGSAQTNVVDGVLRYNSGSLRGGGFEHAVMNTNTNAGDSSDLWQFPVSLGSSSNVTSTHSLGTEALIWGSGSVNGTAPSAGETMTHLECTSCHDPHEFGETYRMLRAQPVDSSIAYRGSTTYAFVTDQLAYASVNASSGILAYDTTDYTEQYYAAPDVYTDNGTQVMVSYDSHGTPVTVPKYSQQISNWCGSCHERYHALKDSDNAPGSVSSGDAIFSYRHKTGDLMISGTESASCGYAGAGCHGGDPNVNFNKELSCLGCHVAHGTSATMDSYAQIPWPGQSATTADGLPGTEVDPDLPGAWDSEWATRSSLLRLDNRAVCQNAYCHPKGTGTYTDGFEQGMD